MIKTFRYENDVDEFSANSYVVGEINGPCVVIDLGSTSNRIIKYIKDNHMSCSGILLTHGHWDHIRGINAFLESFPNTSIFIDENDAELLINSYLNGSKSMDVKEGVVNIEPYRFEDGDELKFSNNLVFEVIETPFHTIGSVCLLDKQDNALFTGDTLFKGDIGRSDLPHSASRMQAQSLAKIKNLDSKLHIFPGHGDDSVLSKELENNIYLR
jgi:Zn-dependent hydrolases, including glyoxylases